MNEARRCAFFDKLASEERVSTRAIMEALASERPFLPLHGLCRLGSWIRGPTLFDERGKSPFSHGRNKART